MRKYILITFFLLYSVKSVSQTKKFHSLTSKDGISQSEVYSILKDSIGFIWFGTVDGLNRFDGYSIKIFNTKKNNPNYLSNNTIRSLAEDRWQRIWIGTDDGLNMYDPYSELIYQIPFANNTENLVINTLLVYQEYLYIATSKGLFRLSIDENLTDPNKLNVQRINTNLSEGNNYTAIIGLENSAHGGIWVSTGVTVSRIIIESHNSDAVTIETPLLNSKLLISDIKEDMNGNLWICYENNGVIRYLHSDNSKTAFLANGTNKGPSSSKCSSITSDKEGNIWIGTLDNGLNLITSDQLNQSDIKFEHIKHEPINPNSLNSNLIYSLYVSDNNILWVGTIGSGLNFFDPNQKKFRHYNINRSNSLTPNSNFIRAVYADDNKIWTGTHNNGLFILDKNSEKFQKVGFETQSVFFIESYNKKKKFICSSNGLSLVQETKSGIKILSEDDNNSQACFFITKSTKDCYWMASIWGIARFKVTNDKIVIEKKYNTNSNPAISAKNCRTLFYDKERNELLLGTEGGGLNILTLNENQNITNVKVFKKSKKDGSISNNYVRSIIKDSDNVFWIGTFEGLNKMIRDSVTGEISFKTYTQEDGLPNNMIQLITEDKQQNLWIGTNNGLSKFIQKEEKFINYSESDGIQSKEFSEHTVNKTKNGEIFMGGINGITSFYPDEITKSDKKPHTNITNFYLFGERVRARQTLDNNVILDKGIIVTDSIILAPNQNNIAFDFSSMLYPNSEKIKYSYILEGFDKNWNFTDASNRNANYTNLKHGKYSFKVKSTNDDGIWENDSKEIFIHIKTPFIYTWYAYLIYLLIAVLIFVYFSYYTIIRYTTKSKLILEQEHRNKIQELEKLRVEFFINISHDLRTPITLIKGPLDSILQKKSLNKNVKEKLDIIKRNVIRLNYLVEQLLDVRKAESRKLSPQFKSQDIVAFTKQEIDHFTYAINKKGLQLNITSEPDEIVVIFDPMMIAKVYFNIISNALRYTNEGEITISIQKVNKEANAILKESNFLSFVKIAISDTGVGFSKELATKIFERFYQNKSQGEKGYGIGLSHTLQLIEAHNGFIEAESQENIGTTISFYIPDFNLITLEAQKTTGSQEDIYIKDSEIQNENTISIDKDSKTILIVEDNSDMRKYIKLELKKEYNILEAEDGLDGIDKAEHNEIDLIISDVMMPNMDGIKFCKHVKSNIKTSHIPVILLTAKADTKTKYEGIETGADDYIPKPFDMDYLIIRIKNLLQSRENLRKLFQENNWSLKPSTVTVTSLDEKFINQLMQAIEKGIPNSEFSVNSLETEMGMSHSNFYRKIKNLTGQSGKEILHDMRMKRAKQLLIDNKDIRIDEVAYMVGFNNPKYFGKSFRAASGVSPSQFRKENT